MATFPLPSPAGVDRPAGEKKADNFVTFLLCSISALPLTVDKPIGIDVSQPLQQHAQAGPLVATPGGRPASVLHISVDSRSRADILLRRVS